MAGLDGGPLCRQGQTANTCFSLTLGKLVFTPGLIQHFFMKYLSFVQVAQIKFIYFFMFDAEK